MLNPTYTFLNIPTSISEKVNHDRKEKKKKSPIFFSMVATISPSREGLFREESSDIFSRCLWIAVFIEDPLWTSLSISLNCAQSRMSIQPLPEEFNTMTGTKSRKRIEKAGDKNRARPCHRQINALPRKPCPLPLVISGLSNPVKVVRLWSCILFCSKNSAIRNNTNWRSFCDGAGHLCNLTASLPACQ